jgi:outer membrane protein OmpA-like peptidoglycan-associated protein
MNWRVVRTVSAAVLFSAMITSAYSQKNYYVVIGAFATEKGDLKEFTSRLPENQSDTAYTIYRDENLLHFYLLKTSNRDEALDKTIRLREVINGRDPQLLNSFRDQDKRNESLEYTLQTPVMTRNDETASSGTSDATAGAGVPVEKEVVLPRGKFFKFQVAAPDGTRVLDNVHHVNLKDGRELGTFTTYGNVDVLRPSSSEPMTVVCGIFGYKEIRKDINYSNPEKTTGAFQDDDGAWVIPYNLERLEKGDVSVMYNVSFYKNAAFMIPTSQRDLDELVLMMKTNPNYVIKLHAHCNAKGKRKILAPGTAGRYFDVEGAREIESTAKQLTYHRAELVKAYLIEHGIDKNRIKTFSWGGTEMLVDEHGPHAKLNDRIEVEILED